MLEKSFEKSNGKGKEHLRLLLPDSMADKFTELFPAVQEQFEKNNLEAGLLIADLFRLKQVSKADNLEIVINELVNTLKKAGEDGYKFFGLQNLNPKQCTESIKKLADLIEKEVERWGYKLRIVSPGVGPNMEWMNYKPGQGNVPVEEAKSWAVMNERGVAVAKANVRLAQHS